MIDLNSQNWGANYPKIRIAPYTYTDQELVKRVDGVCFRETQDQIARRMHIQTWSANHWPIWVHVRSSYAK